MANVELRDGAGPDTDTDHARRRRIGFDQHNPQVFVYLGHDLLLGLVNNAAIGRASDVVEDEHLAIGAAAGEQGA